MATSTATSANKLAPYFKALDEIHQDLHENRQFNLLYLLMLVLAALIAMLGLLVNSPAVIIGAMLISPLMGPVLAIGLALTLADWQVGRKALRNVLLSVIEAILIGALVTWLSPLKESTPEIIARTNPNLMDLLIAFFSGTAGTLALTSRSRGGLTIIPGVAIATAVMPPLVTTGFGIATAQWQVAGGAFMLFFTNLTAIVISADLVFLLVGFRPQDREHRGFVRLRMTVALLVLAVLSVPLLRTLTAAARQASARRQIRAELQQLEKDGRASLNTWDFRMSERRVVVQASVATTESLQPEQVARVEQGIARAMGRTAELRVQQIRVDDPTIKKPGEPNDFVSGGNALRPATAPLAPAAALREVHEKVRVSATQLLAAAGVRDVSVDSVALEHQRLSVRLTGGAAVPLTPVSQNMLASALSREFAMPVQVAGELLIRPEPPLTLRFRPESMRLVTSDELKQMQERIASDASAELTPILVSSSQDPTNLTERRVEFLRERLKVPPRAGQFNDDTLEPGRIAVAFLQALSAEAGETNSEPSARQQ